MSLINKSKEVDYMVSIKDVANYAGVSVATVSRAINNKGYIHEDTLKKVKKAIDDLNYQPNEIARSLNSKTSKLIGLFVPSVEHYFFAELTYIVESTANKYGYKVLLCNSEVDAEKEKSYIEMLKQNQVAGIIMASQNMDVDYYKNIGFPLVMVERHFSTEIPYVVSDNYYGGVLATQKLIDCGCKYLGHIAGTKDIRPANRRTDAFKEIASKNNIKYVIEQCSIGYDAGYKAAYKLLENHPDLDGIFCSSDEVALALMSVAKKFGKKVPEDLNIVGFDGVKLASILGITTIKQPIQEMGEAAVELLMKQIEEGVRKLESKIFPISLVEGITTKC